MDGKLEGTGYIIYMSAIEYYVIWYLDYDTKIDVPSTFQSIYWLLNILFYICLLLFCCRFRRGLIIMYLTRWFVWWTDLRLSTGSDIFSWYELTILLYLRLGRFSSTWKYVRLSRQFAIVSTPVLVSDLPITWQGSLWLCSKGEHNWDLV